MAHLFLKHFTQGIHSFGNLYVKQNKNDNIINEFAHHTDELKYFCKDKFTCKTCITIITISTKGIKKNEVLLKNKTF